MAWTGDANSLRFAPHASHVTLRLVALLCNAASLRDVVAFPKTAQGNELLTGSPASVSDAALKEYHIKISQ